MGKSFKKIYRVLFVMFLLSTLSSCNNKISEIDKEEDFKYYEAENIESDIEEKDKIEDGTINSKELTIYVATDIHYLSETINDKGEAFQVMVESSDGRELNYIRETTEAFLYDIERNNPDILIISGDLTHNGEKASHLDMAKKFNEIEKGGTKVYVTPGNHDINNPYARGFVGSEQVETEKVSSKEFEDIYYDYGFEEAILRDDSTLSYLAMPSDTLWILMLDTNFYDKNIYAPVTSGKLETSTLKWIEKCSDLAKEKGAKILTVMHHNLYNHSELLNKGFTIDNSEKVLEAFREYDLDLVLSGHIHIQNIKADEENEIYDIATGAFIVYPIGYGVINFDSRGYSYKSSIVDVEGWARAVGSTNKDLLNFNEYSKKYFYDKSVVKLTRELLESESYTKEESEAMANVLGILNTNYFGGSIDDVREEVLNSEGYKLWENYSDDGFVKAYIENMLEETNINPRELKIDFK